MREDLEFEPAEVYEPPVLAEVGEYAELTEGFRGHHWDGWAGFHRSW